MATDDGTSNNDERRVVPFRSRAGIPALGPLTHRDRSADSASPVSDLAKYEQTGERDDYRHRMFVNAAALAFTVALVAAGVWIAESMAAMRKSQDCVLMGRRSCTPVTVLPTDRWSGSAPVQQRAATDPRR